MIYEKLLNNIGFTDEMKSEYNRYHKMVGNEVEPYCMAYMRDGISMDDALNGVHKLISEEISEYTLDLLFVLGSTGFLYEDYKKLGISDDIYYNTLSDITYKVNECIRVKNVFGTFVVYWYEGFLRLSRIALGRLQYDFGVKIDNPISVGRLKITPDDYILSCHIPSSGPLTFELCKESYKMAYEFFSDKLTTDFLPIMCHSWMLYPEYKNVFGPNSNLYRFANDFDVVSTNPDENFGDAWRIFDVDYDGDWSKLPQRTSLQKSFVQYIKNGGSFGHGKGLLCVDKSGEKVMAEEIKV